MDTHAILIQLFLAVLLVASLILPSHEGLEGSGSGDEEVFPELAFFKEA